MIQGQIYKPEGLSGCYRVMFWAYKVAALPNTVEESWGDLRFWRVMYSGRKNPSGYFNGLGGCELMSTSFKNINICLFPESSHSLFALESTRKIDDDNEDTTLTPLLAPSAGNLFFLGDYANCLWESWVNNCWNSWLMTPLCASTEPGSKSWIIIPNKQLNMRTCSITPEGICWNSGKETNLDKNRGRKK